MTSISLTYTPSGLCTSCLFVCLLVNVYIPVHSNPPGETKSPALVFSVQRNCARLERWCICNSDISYSNSYSVCVFYICIKESQCCCPSMGNCPNCKKDDEARCYKQIQALLQIQIQPRAAVKGLVKPIYLCSVHAEYRDYQVFILYKVQRFPATGNTFTLLYCSDYFSRFCTI